MPTRHLVIVAAAIFMGLFPARAADPHLTIQGLYDDCKNYSSVQSSFCLGYISGIGDAMHFIEGFRKKMPDVESFAMCGAPSYGAMVQAFINWAEKHPEDWMRSRVYGVMLALGQTWPCESN
jgi:hypothetical protein